MHMRSGTTHDGGFYFGSSSDVDAGYMIFNHSTQVLRFGTNSSARVQIDSFGLRPSIDDTYDLGSGSLRFDDVYATNSTIQTSDGRLKKAIKPSALGLRFINALSPVSYQWRSTPQRKTKKDGRPDRTHYGLIAQQVKSTLDEMGIDSVDFAGYVFDEDSDAMGLRYGEFISPMIKAIQELSKKVEVLENGHSG